MFSGDLVVFLGDFNPISKDEVKVGVYGLDGFGSKGLLVQKVQDKLLINAGGKTTKFSLCVSILKMDIQNTVTMDEIENVFQVRRVL